MTLLERAARDRMTRGDEKLKAALEAARALAPSATETAPGEPSSSVGRIDVVRPDRNFGFLVDESDGVRRHFRLRGLPGLRVGDRVSYVPVEEEKGPAARELARV